MFNLPFAPESFDYIYSIGVLHHTPNCEQAFKALPGLLKPGGRIAIWLYSGYNRWYHMSDVYRKLTRRMSPEALHKLCHVVIPLYWIHQGLRRTPLVGKPAAGALAWLIPMSFNKDATWRVLDTFDWYSPWYQSKHTYEEVFRWFEDCGLEDLRVIEQPPLERLPLDRCGVADHAREYARQCIDHHDRRGFAPGKHVVANRQLVGHQGIGHPLIHAFVAAANHDQPLEAAQPGRLGVSKLAPLRRPAGASSYRIMERSIISPICAGNSRLAAISSTPTPIRKSSSTFTKKWAQTASKSSVACSQSRCTTRIGTFCC